MPSWRARSRIFDAILDWMGIRAEVFDGGLPSMEKSSAFTSQHLVYSKLPRGIMRGGSE
jgi:hypothetical protein